MGIYESRMWDIKIPLFFQVTRTATKAGGGGGVANIFFKNKNKKFLKLSSFPNNVAFFGSFEIICSSLDF